MLGLPREAQRLTALSQAAAGEHASLAWDLAQENRGEQLLDAGRAVEAAEVFQRILDRLGDSPSFERAATLSRLGRSFRASGRLDQAAQCCRESIEVTATLEPSEDVKRLTGVLHTDLADVLVDTGQYAEARKEYETGFEILQGLGDVRPQAVVLGQFGTLAMVEGKLGEALHRYRAALALFQQLREPASEAIGWYQLGRVFQEAGQWEKAERHFRESARLTENLGLIGGANGAAASWDLLAEVSERAGKPEAAEQWYRKAIDAVRDLGDPIGLSANLHNLADLLRHQTARLPEARALADEALGIKKQLDPAAAQIWNIYNLLANIAEQEAAATTDSRRQAALQAEAREHRRLAREYQRDFAGTQHALQRHLPLIAATVTALRDPTKKQLFQETLARYGHASWNELCTAIRRIVAGERDKDLLQEGQFGESPMIIETILAALADPSALEGLPPSDGQAS